MQSTILEKLFASFTDLEGAINSAKSSLAKRTNVPEQLITRLHSYDGILVKQRNLAEELQRLIARGEWDEVNRVVGLINGLSAMIRDDAKAILSAISGMPSDEADAEDDMIIC